MTHLLYIGLFGAVGAVSRYLMSGWAAYWFGEGFPYGTLLVNVLGCFLLGVLFHLGMTTDLFTKETREALAFGFLGGLTTFSTFGLETYRRLEDGTWLLAAGNVAANVVVGLIAVWAGITLARAVFGGA